MAAETDPGEAPLSQQDIDAATKVRLRELIKEKSPTPFLRMVRTQIFSTAGDSLFSVALAGTIFFANEPTEARWRVALYLALTVAPFILAAPFIGPVLDRVAGGRRWALFGAAAGRAILAFVVMRDLNSVWFYPEVFAMLVLGKVHLISKAAIVPSTVPDAVPLVRANSRLSLFAVLSGAIFAPIGLALGALNSQIPLSLAVVMFSLAAWQISGLPNVVVATAPETPEGLRELASLPIKFAANALVLTRSLLGFFIFFAAFNIKNMDRPLWWLAVVAVAAQGGYFVGVVLAPWLRRRIHEQQTISLALGLMFATSIMSLGLLLSETIGPRTALLAVALFAFTLGASASAAKLSFDALVQHDAPDANRGRMFSSFEMRFQMGWALGALLAVIVPFPDTVALAFVSVMSLGGLVMYTVGRSTVKQHSA
jgi:hypothetical protein